MDEGQGQPPKIEHPLGSGPRVVVFWVGCGLAASMTVSMVLDFLTRQPQGDITAWAAAGVCGGLLVGLFRASTAEMPPDKLWLLLRRLLIGGSIGFAFCSGVFAPLVNPQIPLAGAIVVSIIGLVFGIVSGMIWGILAVRARLDREKRDFKARAIRAAAEDAARDALEAAIADKFGPLDEARRDSIQNYDQQRIAETAQRLPGAVRIEDLDGDTP